MTVKLADFGTTCRMHVRGYLTRHCGTAPYMSPEVIARNPYGFKTDVWSMGVSAYVILYGAYPYATKSHTPEDMKEQILLGEPEPEFVRAAPTGIVPSTDAQCFVRSLMARKQEDRCTSKESLQL